MYCRIMLDGVMHGWVVYDELCPGRTFMRGYAGSDRV